MPESDFGQLPSIDYEPEGLVAGLQLKVSIILPFDGHVEPKVDCVRTIGLPVRLQHLFGVLQRRVGQLRPAHHSSDLARAIFGIEPANRGSCPAS